MTSGETSHVVHWCSGLVASLGGCGGDDGTKIKCSVTLTGDVEAVEPECSAYICETPDFDDLSAQVFMNAPVMFVFRGSLTADGGFTAKSYTLDD